MWAYRMKALAGPSARVDMRVLRFLGTGLLNTAFGYGVYAALLFAGLPYLAALLIATVAGVLFNYFSFGRMVFRDRNTRAFGRFVASYVVTYAANALMLHLAIGLGLNAYIAQGVCILPTVALSWLLLNHWVYAR